MMNANLKRTVGQLKSVKLAPEKLRPIIRDLPSKFIERADQVLLGLAHTKDSIPTMLKQTLNRIENNPNDLVGRVGRQVLERAEIVRKQLIEKAEDSGSLVNPRWVPEWLKEMSFAPAARTDGSAPAARTHETAPVAAESAPLKAAKPKAAKPQTPKSATKKKKSSASKKA